MADETQDQQPISDKIQPPELGHWDDMVEGMHDYLETLSERATSRSERLEEKAAAHQETIDALEKARRKRRNYGTRTGIVLKDEQDEHNQ